MKDKVKIRGVIYWELAEKDLIIAKGEIENLVTLVGNQMYSERGSGIAGALAAATGMKLGLGNITPSSIGAGAALASYLSGSQQGFVATYPQSSLSGGKRQIQYQCIWGPGIATTSQPITEVVLVNDGLNDASSSANNTIARALISSIPQKAAGQSITLTWAHIFG